MWLVGDSTKGGDGKNLEDHSMNFIRLDGEDCYFGSQDSDGFYGCVLNRWFSHKKGVNEIYGHIPRLGD